MIPLKVETHGKWFHWDKLESLEMPSPYVPKLASLDDTAHFDKVVSASDGLAEASFSLNVESK